MALNGLICADVPLSNYSLTPMCPHPQPIPVHNSPTLVHSYNSLFTFMNNICIEPK